MELGVKHIMHWRAERIEIAPQPLVILLIALSICLFAEMSHAAGRIFYDGFESGNTNLWSKDSYHNTCRVVTSSVDGVVGPRSGSNMARCNSDGAVHWSTPERFETLRIDSLSYTNELFYRFQVRIDQNFDRTTGSCGKILRIYAPGPPFNDMFNCVRPSAGLKNEGTAGGQPFSSYWGNAPGDSSSSSDKWHQVEYYFNASNGRIRVWHDDVLVRDITVGAGFGGGKWYPFFLQSNFEDSHDATNHSYFDDVEIFSDSATGASGSMADGSISMSDSISPKPPSEVIVR